MSAAEPVLFRALRANQLDTAGRNIINAVEQAGVLVVASPVYRASYTGALKHLFAFFNALSLPTSIYATEADFDGDRLTNPDIIARVRRAVAELAAVLPASARSGSGRPFTLTLHDPVRWKYSILGKYFLNGENPPLNAWS